MNNKGLLERSKLYCFVLYCLISKVNLFTLAISGLIVIEKNVKGGMGRGMWIAGNNKKCIIET